MRVGVIKQEAELRFLGEVTPERYIVLMQVTMVGDQS